MRLLVLFAMSMMGFLLAAEDPPTLTVGLAPMQGSAFAFVRGTPMRVNLMFNNTSDADIQLFAGENWVTCTCLMADGRPLPVVAPDTRIHAKPMPVRVPKGLTIGPPIYLNNTCEFPFDGTFTVSWKLASGVIKDQAFATFEQAGEFRSSIVAGTAEQITADLDRYADFFANSTDRDVKIAMIEGLGSIRSPVVLPRLERCLTAGGMFSGHIIFLMWNRWCDDHVAQAVIDRFLLHSTDTHAINLAIDAAIDAKRLIPDEALQRLLSSNDPPLRYCGLHFVKGTLSHLRLDLLAREGEQDPTAGTIMSYLQDILKKNPSTPPNKEKATANGF